MSSSNPTFTLGVEIRLKDMESPVTPDAGLGLYGRESNLSASAASGQKNVVVFSISEFDVGDPVYISDSSNAELNTVASKAGSTLTMATNLQNTYLSSSGGKVAAGSVFRWIQADIGIVGWSSSMLAKQGIGRFSKKASWKRGGDIARPGQCNISVLNYMQFQKELLARGVNLSGLLVRLYRWEGTGIGTGLTKYNQWAGFVEKPVWNPKLYKIPCKTHFARRRANIGTQINKTAFPDASESTVGKNIPVSIGEFLPIYDEVTGKKKYNNYAKAIRTADDTNDWVNSSDVRAIKEISPDNLTVFAVIQAQVNDPWKFRIMIGDTLTEGIPSGTYWLQQNLEGRYMLVVGGDNSVGVYRKITYVDFYSTPGQIWVYTDRPFTDPLDTTARVKFVSIEREYNADVFKCRGFIDQDGALVTNGLSLSSYLSDAKKFADIPQWGLEIIAGGAGNKLKIDANYFESDPNNLVSFIIKPVKSIKRLCSTNDSDGWLVSDWRPRFPSIFIKGEVKDVEATYEADSEKATDRDGATSYRIYGSFGTLDVPPTNPGLAFPVVVEKPDYPADYDFDEIHLIIKAKFECKVPWSDYWEFYTQFFYRTFKNLTFRKTLFSIRRPVKQSGWNDYISVRDGKFYLSTMPDFYYLTNPPDTKNTEFYLGDDGVREKGGTIPYEYEIMICEGYKHTPSDLGMGRTEGSFKFDIAGKNDYDSIKEMLFDFIVQANVVGNSNNRDYNFEINEMAFAFSKSFDIRDDVYSKFGGRVFVEDWGGRKNINNMIQSPLEVLEYAARMQNWSETSKMPGNGWGKNYPAFPLINLSGDGSFDESTLKGLSDGFEISRQIQSYGDCYTDKIKKSICRDFFVGSYINASGYESVVNLRRREITTGELIDFDKLIDRNRVTIKDPDPADIFPEPFVRYGINPETGGYEGIIKFTNVDAEAFSPAYVEAPDGLFSPGEAEEYWDKCKALWGKSREINIPTSDLTDMKWANGKDCEKLAKDKILNWIDWMGHYRFVLQTGYSIVKDWEEGKRFELQLPHQTDDIKTEALVEEITKSPNKPYVAQIKGILFFEGFDEYLIQDVMGSMPSDDSWIDSYIPQGGDNDIENSY
ncbi:MAG: hypothetical protein U9Q21_02570 [Candidatus Auribacterota bacterium]|nr:hypothetical protein [Candidatus Auribacterota bacterium]